MRIFFISLFCFLCFWGQNAHASEMDALRGQVQDLTRAVQDLRLTVENQQREIALLKGQAPPPFTTTGQPLRQAQGPALAPGSRSLQGKWNPDIGVVADVVFSSDTPRSDEEGADRIAARELELVLGSPVDPYSHLDATISFSDFDAASLEEAYYTHFDLLGWGITGRLGRFKPVVGKAAAVHRDNLDTVDEPLVIQHYFGKEGLSKSGLDFSRDIDLPWPVTHRLTAGILEGGNGEDGTLFGDARRRQTFYAHFKNYVDLSDAAGLEFGVTSLTGSRDADSEYEVSALGLDGMLMYHYADQRHVKLQSEAYRVSRAESFYLLENATTGAITQEDLDDARHLWGEYVLLDWRFHPQWAVGFRFDDVQLIETASDFANPNSTENATSGYATFYQSEFARWRAQVTHVNLTDAKDDNRIFVQGTFAIGEHKHKLQ